MGNEVLSQINRTVRAFVTHDRELARQVIEDDAEINDYEVKLERKSFEIIALQQPVSQDLRVVMTVLKAVSDLERMGDHAVSIAKATIRMKGEVVFNLLRRDQQDGPWSQRFCRSDTRCLPQRRWDLAYEVASRDEVINHYFDSIEN